MLPCDDSEQEETNTSKYLINGSQRYFFYIGNMTQQFWGVQSPRLSLSPNKLITSPSSESLHKREYIRGYVFEGYVTPNKCFHSN